MSYFIRLTNQTIYKPDGRSNPYLSPLHFLNKNTLHDLRRIY